LEYEQINALANIGSKIADGAAAFLRAEYTVMCVFIIVFGAIVFIIVDWLGQLSDNRSFRVYATAAYVIGSFTSMFCGWIGMTIAVKANYRTTYRAVESLEGAFQTAYAAGSVMGFSMIGTSMMLIMGLLILYVHLFNPVIPSKDPNSWAVLMELLAGYGLGGSSIALFGRVGGGIYTKAADVGADLVGKVEEGLDEDSPKNPATIADNVGDNVGDVAGMGADLFGSFAESTCAALVFIASTSDLMTKEKNAIYFPIMISAVGIVACFLTSVFGIYCYKVTDVSRIEQSLKYQLIISTVLTLILLPFAAYQTLPEKWNFEMNGKLKETNRWYATIATAVGLVSGL